MFVSVSISYYLVTLFVTRPTRPADRSGNMFYVDDRITALISFLTPDKRNALEV